MAMLSNDDLSDILRGLHHARTSWYYIGLQLRESVDTLDGIREQFKDPDDRLRETITHWLKQVEPTPTWRALVNALKTHSVGEGRLAGRLERGRCSEWSESCGTEEQGTRYFISDSRRSKFLLKGAGPSHHQDFSIYTPKESFWLVYSTVMVGGCELKVYTRYAHNFSRTNFN